MDRRRTLHERVNWITDRISRFSFQLATVQRSRERSIDGIDESVIAYVEEGDSEHGAHC